MWVDLCIVFGLASLSQKNITIKNRCFQELLYCKVIKISSPVRRRRFIRIERQQGNCQASDFSFIFHGKYLWFLRKIISTEAARAIFQVSLTL